VSSVLDPFRFVLIAVAGWMNQQQLHAIDYLREENRILRKQLGTRRLRLSDAQRRRLAVKAKGVGRKVLTEIATIVTPATLMAWPKAHCTKSSLHENTTEPHEEKRGSLELPKKLRNWLLEWQRRIGTEATVASRAPCPISVTNSPAARLPRFWNDMESSLNPIGNGG
jgi:hypothetical protein